MSTSSQLVYLERLLEPVRFQNGRPGVFAAMRARQAQSAYIVHDLAGDVIHIGLPDGCTGSFNAQALPEIGRALPKLQTLVCDMHNVVADVTSWFARPGALPASLTVLVLQRDLSLTGVGFTGNVGCNFGAALPRGLKALNLCGNCLSGTITSFESMPQQLEMLHLGGGNKFSGTVGKDFFASLPRSLQYLSLTVNRFAAAAGVDGVLMSDLPPLLDSFYLIPGNEHLRLNLDLCSLLSRGPESAKRNAWCHSLGDECTTRADEYCMKALPIRVGNAPGAPTVGFRQLVKVVAARERCDPFALSADFLREISVHHAADRSPEARQFLESL